GIGEYIVVAFNPEAVQQYYGVSLVLGPWTGGLSNDGETLALADATGSLVNRLRYADQGDWAQRILGPRDRNHRGWFWQAAHDGQGRSLELIHHAQDNTYGQNWRASLAEDGTPGQANSVADATAMPMIKDVKQAPLLPTSVDEVQVRATIDFGQTGQGDVTLYYRVDQSRYERESTYPRHDSNTYTTLRMQSTGDSTYQASIPAQASGTIIEFFVQAGNGQAQIGTWPAPAVIDGTEEQATNALYQVKDAWDHLGQGVPDNQPVYYVIMTEMERARLADIGDGEGGEQNSDAQMNATFISTQGPTADLRYNVSVRNRGHGSRNSRPNNMRVNFKSDKPWHSVSSININAQYGYRQVIGSALFQLAGLPVSQAKLVQLRVNGDNLAVSSSRMYGSYAHVEVINDEFAARQFPGDNNGSVYKCMRDGGPGADLVHRGNSPSGYTQNYFKKSNRAKNDWSDLYDLTYQLTESPDDTYLDDVRSRVHIEAWLKFLALNELLGNTETTLANGSPDDYYLYAGAVDSRFYLIQHDLDSIFQRNGVDILRFWGLPALARLISDPTITLQYYRTLDEYMASLLSPAGLRQVFGRLSLSGVPDSALEGMINYAANRYAQVRPRIQGSLTMETTLPMGEQFLESSGRSVMLSGKADPVLTGSILVNGHLAHWSPLEAAWSLGSRSHPGSGISTLQPGLTRITAEAFYGPNGTGRLLDSTSIDVAYQMATPTDLGGTLDADTLLLAGSGPYRVTEMLTVPDGVTLTIEAGTTLFFDPTAGLTVQSGGCLKAVGTQDQVIRWTRTPTSDTNWQGLRLDHTRQENRLCYMDFEQGDGQGESVAVEYATVLMDHVAFGGTERTVLELHHPDAMIRHCEFPSVATESVHGTGLSGDESLVFDNCIFGAALGTSDIIDFAGGARSGPILQCYNCIFLGGPDDGLDLDGTDAHIQGNLFMNFH
ncbi:MAG: CotH kinase family protein, partial [Phycisphaeraceae bacterium]|nr:CotH kinase family protein [Phycisphaeraceae bacterium]